MVRRINIYEVKRGDNIADPNYLTSRFEDIDERLHAREESDSALDNAIQRVEQVGIERINNVITPLALNAMEKLSTVASVFEALSSTQLSVGLGQKTLVIREEDRAVWALPGYVRVVKVDDPQTYMAGPVLSFNRQTGTVVFDCEVFGGAGQHSNWSVLVSGERGPRGERGEKGESSSVQSAQDLPATAPPGFTGNNAQAVINSIGASVNTKAAASHTHAISDVTNLQAALDGKAAASHTHAISDVTNLQATLNGKAAASHTHATSDVIGLQDALDGKAESGHTHDSRYMRIDTSNSLSYSNVFATKTINAGSSITWNCATHQVAKIVLTTNSSISSIQNAVDGGVYILFVKQDLLGGRTLTFSSSFKFSGGTPQIDTGSYKVTIFTFIAQDGTMYGTYTKGFA